MECSGKEMLSLYNGQDWDRRLALEFYFYRQFMKVLMLKKKKKVWFYGLKPGAEIQQIISSYTKLL